MLTTNNRQNNPKTCSGGGWKLISTFSPTVTDTIFEFKDLPGYTEFFIETEGLKNSSAQDSQMRLYLNGIEMGSLRNAGSKGAETSYDRLAFKFNGLYWEFMRASGRSNNSEYSNVFTTIQGTYSVITKVRNDSVGSCHTLTLVQHPTADYRINSGTISIYARGES